MQDAELIGLHRTDRRQRRARFCRLVLRGMPWPDASRANPAWADTLVSRLAEPGRRGLEGASLGGRRADHALPHRAMPQRHPAGHAAVSARRRADVDLRDHGSGQSGARFALHARCVLRRDLCGADRQLPGRHRTGAGRDARGWNGHGGDRNPAALWPRSSRPRARHLRATDLLQRAGAADLGSGRA